MKDMLVIGAGGHAKVVVDIIEAQALFRVRGLVVNDHAVGSRVDDVVVVGADADLADLRKAIASHAVVAIGDNRRRRLVFDEVVRAGLDLPALVHPSAVISRRASVSDGSVVMPNAVINAGSAVGRGCIVNSSASIDHDCVIGDFAHIAPQVALAGSVRIGDGVFVGIGACVIPGVQIGRGAIIGAGSVVVHDIPENAVAVGAPARPR